MNLDSLTGDWHLLNPHGNVPFKNSCTSGVGLFRAFYSHLLVCYEYILPVETGKKSVVFMTDDTLFHISLAGYKYHSC